jgi:hypothetical protein
MVRDPICFWVNRCSLLRRRTLRNCVSRALDFLRIISVALLPILTDAEVTSQVEHQSAADE